jgi:hypothetical protein
MSYGKESWATPFTENLKNYLNEKYPESNFEMMNDGDHDSVLSEDGTYLCSWYHTDDIFTYAHNECDDYDKLEEFVKNSEGYVVIFYKKEALRIGLKEEIEILEKIFKEMNEPLHNFYFAYSNQVEEDD